MKTGLSLTLLAAAAVLPFAGAAFAQGGRGGGGAPGGGRGPAAPKAAAPVDLTGYWVSLVTEDWRFRMVTPPKGDYASVPINAEARKVADAWDPDKDIASGNQCKAYGAAALMRAPGRLHIDWADDNTLKIDTDAGTQTRLFHFGAAGRAAVFELLQLLRRVVLLDHGHHLNGFEERVGGHRVRRVECPREGFEPGAQFRQFECLLPHLGQMEAHDFARVVVRAGHVLLHLLQTEAELLQADDLVQAGHVRGRVQAVAGTMGGLRSAPGRR